MENFIGENEGEMNGSSREEGILLFYNEAMKNHKKPKLIQFSEDFQGTIKKGGPPRIVQKELVAIFCQQYH